MSKNGTKNVRKIVKEKRGKNVRKKCQKGTKYFRKIAKEKRGKNVRKGVKFTKNKSMTTVLIFYRGQRVHGRFEKTTQELMCVQADHLMPKYKNQRSQTEI